ncbi:hypothetical protein C942_02504 [Photobacterium marinum]|uniref:Alpha/beta hydrolase n=1 Tax=Photobacterium marinum TaxID=1056511 RepID=L8J6J4_9GAMM|nr:hypothetical protein [Photobacterium marinum]ELR64480.1 hypothetical protein C942_02504 [Photobacterium marinum]
MKSTLFAACLVLLMSGCNSGSSNSTTQPINQPKADYHFSDNALEEVLEERLAVLNSMNLTFDGKVYSTLKFSDDLYDDKLVMLSNIAGDSVILRLTDMSKSGSNCVIYFDSSNIEQFDCSPSKISSSSDRSLLESQTDSTAKTVRLEFLTEAYNYLTAIGSTILSAQLDSGEVNVKTSFAFDQFYRDVICSGTCSNRVNSTLGVTTYLQLKKIIESHNGLKMNILFNNHIGGSADDDINMYTGLLINDNQMNTFVTKNGSVFSGGTDLFAAGEQRILERATKVGPIEQAMQIGVHSWSEGDKTAKDIPYTDESHRKQATYFNHIMGTQGIPFYMFTLDSAPAKGAHWVTQADSDKYGLITKLINPKS